MTIVHHKVMKKLATSPSAWMRFQCTGATPSVIKPDSPLIRALLQIPPSMRARIIGFTVGPELGYSGSRTFPTAAHALRWVRPSETMISGEHWPAESWRIKSFRQPLALQQLLAHASSYPPGLLPLATPAADQDDEADVPRG